MSHRLLPVDVIFLSGVDGEIRPLRIRAEAGFDHAIIGNVREILRSSQNTLFGAESHTFLCRICANEAAYILELKYFVNSHRWFVSTGGG